MRPGRNDDDQPAFNDIRIDLRGGGGAASGWNNNQSYYPTRYPTENDQRSQGSVPSRISRYSGKEYMQSSSIYCYCSLFFLDRISSSTTNKSVVFESINDKNTRFQSSTRRCTKFEKFSNISESSSKIRSTSTTSTIGLAMVSNLMYHSLLSIGYVSTNQ